jgi:Protein of unknown function (DUF2914)
MMKRWMIWCQVMLGIGLIAASLTIGIATTAGAQETDGLPPRQLHLSEAAICETLEAFKPLNPSVVFSVKTGSVMCFTAFDHVPEQTSIFHDWIRQDKLVFRKKLVLKPPRWSSVSSIQLREADKGVWRVEIRDADGNFLRILRFSITD